MIDKQRIDEAQNNVRSYLAEGLLKKIVERDNKILRVLKKNSEESLRVADLLFKENISSLWVIVCSYYSMYYIANAVLYNLCYKIGHKISHKITADSLIVFVKDKLKQQLLEDYEEVKQDASELALLGAEEIIKSFYLELDKRSRFQYTTSEFAKKTKAETSLKRAKIFILEMEKLLLP